MATRPVPPHVTDTTKCHARNRAGKQCGKWPIAGARNCRIHAGGKQARADAAVRAELARWVITTDNIDPAATLLQLLAQSRRRVDEYSTRLAHLVDEHGGDLAEAMVADQFVMSESGHLQKVGEYIRGLAQLEAQERDRCARFAELAIRAGIAERQVRLAEKEGAMIASVLRAVLADPRLALSDAQRAAVPEVARAHLQLLPA
jgi:sulfite reductase beta subunit-like hemoprotein